MGRSTARELIRAAQTAELHKDADRAVALLEEAARIHLANGEPGRAAVLFRHCLRLTPGRADLERAREAAELAAETHDLGEGAAPSLPLSSDMAEALAEVEALVAESPAAQPQPDSDEQQEHQEQPQPPARVRTLELPQRGPTVADPAIECWCSFCCRPKAEVGPMVAGPAGAFICGACIESAAAIAGRQVAAIPEPSSAASAQPSARGEPRDFIEAAVLLSRALGWSLAEVRSLSAEERERALAVLAGLGPDAGR